MRNRAKDQVTLALIRHGATKANEEHRYIGTTDEALSEYGIEALQLYQAQDRYPKVSYLFTSPMKRCLETAEILYPDLSPVVIPEWTEMDFGSFEYKNYKELKDDMQYQAWVDSAGTLAVPGGESRKEFMLRCEQGFIKMCRTLRCLVGPNAAGPIRAGAIAHGGIIMALFCMHGGAAYYDHQAANGRGYLCRMKGWGRYAQLKEAGKI